MIDDEDTGEQEGKDIYSGFSSFVQENLNNIVDNDKNSRYITVTEDEDGELMLELPDDFMESLGWQVGDTLSWRKVSEVSWSIRKMNDG